MSHLARGDRVSIRRPESSDVEMFCAAVDLSADLHGEWVHPPATAVSYELWLTSVREHGVESHLILTHGGALVGVANINNIARGPLMSGSLGYYGFADSAGKGLVREGVGLVIGRAFSELGLHRLEANIQPNNVASRRLAEALGLRLEGFSPGYMRIGGRWRDHERWAIVS